MDDGRWTRKKEKRGMIRDERRKISSLVPRPSSLVTCILFLATGCAAAPVGSSSFSPSTPPAFSLSPTTPVVPNGVYHSIKKGETLWKIARFYEVSIEEVIRINRLPDATKVKIGQRIFIPGTHPMADIPGPVMNTALIPEQGFIWPANGKILSYFNSPKGRGINKGIDVVLQPGTPIMATREGKVSFAHEKLKGLGKTIILDHGDGYQTLYSHLSEILVTPGEKVSQGKVIARSGNTGRTLGVSFLHFEVRKDHKPRNPLHYLP